MKTNRLFFLVAIFALITLVSCEDNSDILKPNVKYYTSDYFLNDSLYVSDVIGIGSDCRLVDATSALIVDEDDIYFYFLSKAYIDNVDGKNVVVKRTEFKIRKVHLNKTIAYIRNAPMNTDEIVEWEDDNDIDNYRETSNDADADAEDNSDEVKFEDW